MNLRFFIFQGIILSFALSTLISPILNMGDNQTKFAVSFDRDHMFIGGIDTIRI
jgi:hypothetical protein